MSLSGQNSYLKALLVFLLCVCLVAFANEDPKVATVKRLMNEAEYDRAEKIIARGLNRPHLSASTRVQLYWLQATCLITLSKKSLAKSSLLKVLALNPEFVPDPNISPKILDLFHKAKQHFAKAGGLDHIYQPRLSPIVDQQRKQSTNVVFAIENTKKLIDISQVVLYMRRLGTSDYSSIDLTKDLDNKGVYVGTVPPSHLISSLNSYAVEYYVEALSINSTRLTGVGSSKLPLTFLILSDSENLAKEVIKTNKHPVWPYLVGVGSVVLGSVIMGIVYFTAPKQSEISLTIHQ